MNFPRYDRYKDSGVEWLDEVPAHWEVWPLKRVAALKSGETIRPDEINEAGEYPVFGGNGHRGFTGSYTHDGFFALIGRQGALCGNVNYGSGKFWASEHAVVVSPIRPLITNWLGELLGAMNLGRYSVSAAQPGLSVEIIRSLLIPVPPLDDQKAIAAFLDRETAKIDALVGEQQNLIGLLKEKRQALISNTVTKGLDPAAPMKDSGAAWLGEVPTHWSRKRLKALFRQAKRQGYADKEVLSVYREFGVIAKDSRSDNFNKTPEDIGLYQLVEAGDLVVNKMKAWQGSLGISALCGITSPDYIVFVPTHGERSEYLHLLFRSKAMVSTYLAISNGIRTNQWRLEPQAFLSQWIFLPPVEEQQAIATFVEEHAAKWDALAAEAEETIILLQERRTALISAAVTGKIDVRGSVGAAAALETEAA